MNTTKRTFLFGDQWCYYKIYCDVRSADLILTNQIQELTSDLLHSKLVDKWFFIRYKDPDNQIRVRFRLASPTNLLQVVQRLNDVIGPLLDNGLVWNVQIDTYKRELERYGASAIELTESIFLEQSITVLRLLNERITEEHYFLMVLRYTKAFISLFNLGDEKENEFFNRCFTLYFEEFGRDKNLKVDLDKKYRKLSSSIMQSLHFPIKANVPFRKMEVLVVQILELDKRNQLGVPLKDLITSHVHMFINRAFRDQQRLYEMLVYSFLNKVSRAQSKIKSTT